MIKGRLLAMLSAFAVVNMAVWYWLFFPQLETYRNLTRAWQAKSGRHQELLQMAQQLRLYENAPLVYAHNEELYRQNACNEQTSMEIRIFLHELGQRLGIADLQPEESKKKPASPQAYTPPRTDKTGSLSFHIKAAFTYQQLVGFFDSLAKDPRFFIVTSLDITSSYQDGAPLRVEIWLDYVYFSAPAK